MNIKNELLNFAEEFRSQMSVNVYEGIRNIIQSLDDAETKAKKLMCKHEVVFAIYGSSDHIRSNIAHYKCPTCEDKFPNTYVFPSSTTVKYD